MIEYAGQTTLLPTPEIEAFIAKYLDPEWCRYFYDPAHGPEVGAFASTIPRMNWQKTFQPRINTLVWPTGASRWASMLLLVTNTQLAAIKAATDITYAEETTPVGQQLVLADGAFSGEIADDAFTRSGNHIALSTRMFALDARPISVPFEYQYNEGTDAWEWVATAEKTLWLLPIVDERWFWQWIDIGRPDDPKTWAGMLTEIAERLAVTSSRTVEESYVLDTVDDLYCEPIEVYANLRYSNAAEMFDAVAHSVGQRAVRRIDGTLRTLTPITAGSRWDANLDHSEEVIDEPEAMWQRIAGDSYAGSHKAAATLPAKFHVIFEDDFAEIVSADEAGAIEWGPAGTRATIHVIGNGDGCNKHLYAQQAAADYIGWLYRKADVTFAGIKCWEMTGFEDVVIWSFSTETGITTRIVTHPENLGMTPAGGNNTEVLYALPACNGVGIPAATDQTHPGKALCCLFWLKLDSDREGYTPTDRVIRPLKRDGKHVRQWVYNPYPVAAKDCEYLPVGRMPTGSLTLLSSPPEVCVFATTTTSTTNSGTTTPPGVGAACVGKSRCKMVWDTVERTWTKDSGCENTTSTTSTTTTAEGATTSSSTSSTTTTCACPVSTTTTTTTTSEGTTTSTSTTSTTTTGECKCQMPTFCGWEEGQCTYTYCTVYKVGPQPCTTTTTSTTTSFNPEDPVPGCNCATTCSPTTTRDPEDPPPPTCTQCGIVRAGYGPGSFVNGCSGGTCICPYWSIGDVGPCSSKFVDCQIVPVVPPPPPRPCSGNCTWWPIDGQYWLLGTHSCTGGFRGCGCYAPNSAPPSGCPGPTVTGCAEPEYTEEEGGGGGTTKPPNCCVNCNTTTTPPPSTTSSTTSTTTTGCGSECRWFSARTNEWDLEENPCPESCPCARPGLPSEESCDTAVTKCGTGETTTTTTSSTTSTTTTGEATTTSTSTTTTTTTTTTTSTTTTLDPCYGIAEGPCGSTPGCMWDAEGGCHQINCTNCTILPENLCEQCVTCYWIEGVGCVPE